MEDQAVEADVPNAAFSEYGKRVNIYTSVDLTRRVLRIRPSSSTVSKSGKSYDIDQLIHLTREDSYDTNTYCSESELDVPTNIQSDPGSFVLVIGVIYTGTASGRNHSHYSYKTAKEFTANCITIATLNEDRDEEIYILVRHLRSTTNYVGFLSHRDANGLRQFNRLTVRSPNLFVLECWLRDILPERPPKNRQALQAHWMCGIQEYATGLRNGCSTKQEMAETGQLEHTAVYPVATNTNGYEKSMASVDGSPSSPANTQLNMISKLLEDVPDIHILHSLLARVPEPDDEAFTELDAAKLITAYMVNLSDVFQRSVPIPLTVERICALARAIRGGELDENFHCIPPCQMGFFLWNFCGMMACLEEVNPSKPDHKICVVAAARLSHSNRIFARTIDQVSSGSHSAHTRLYQLSNPPKSSAGLRESQE